MKNVVILFLLIVLFSCKKSPQGFSSIEDKLKNEYSAETAGIALSVVSNDSTIWSMSFGMANIAEQKPMTTSHILNIASVSKVFVATAIMQLSEKELLSIHDDINMHLPFLVNYKDDKNSPITIQHLLTHRSSIIDGSYYENSYATESNRVNLSDWLENYLSESGTAYSISNFSESKPGDKWNYSNIGFGLLALIVENVSKTPFEVYCEQHIFEPLEMHNTAWKQTKDSSFITTSYAYFDEKPIAKHKEQIAKLLESAITVNTYLPITPYHFPNYPDGLLYSSVSDLSKFAQCILNDGHYKNHQLLDSETINRMFEIQGTVEDKQGICWRFTGFGNIWGHGGDDPGVQTGLYLDRKKNRAMIMIKNSNLGSRTQVMKDLYLASID